MKKDENVFYEIDGKEYCDEELALSILLREGVLFCNERKVVFEGEPEETTTVLYVNANDVFAWACADAEPLPNDEIGNLYKLHKAKEGWGVTKWLCKQRNQKPQKPIEKDMKKAGAWDEIMKALPDNTQDAEVKASFDELRVQLASEKKDDG